LEIYSEWEDINYCGKDITERMKVIGGWIVRNFSENQTTLCFESIAMVFVPDPEHKWIIIRD
jgi:hypothetical protein